MAQMYTRGSKYGDKEGGVDNGIHVAMLRDDQNPEDVHPRIPAALRGKVLRLHTPKPKVPQMPVSVWA